MIRSLIVVVVVVPAPRSEKSKQILHAKTHVFNLVTTQRRRSKCALLVLQLSMKLRMWDTGRLQPTPTTKIRSSTVLSILSLKMLTSRCWPKRCARSKAWSWNGDEYSCNNKCRSDSYLQGRIPPQVHENNVVACSQIQSYSYHSRSQTLKCH